MKKVTFTTLLMLSLIFQGTVSNSLTLSNKDLTSKQIATVKKVEELSIKIENSIYASIENSDLLIVLTEWDEFSKIDPKSISAKFRQKNIIDSRNILDKKIWQDAGFNFLGNGS